MNNNRTKNNYKDDYIVTKCGLTYAGSLEEFAKKQTRATGKYTLVINTNIKAGKSGK